jgi:hypothetical protein
MVGTVRGVCWGQDKKLQSPSTLENTQETISKIKYASQDVSKFVHVKRFLGQGGGVGLPGSQARHSFRWLLEVRQRTQTSNDLIIHLRKYLQGQNGEQRGLKISSCSPIFGWKGPGGGGWLGQNGGHCSRGLLEAR